VQLFGPVAAQALQCLQTNAQMLVHPLAVKLVGHAGQLDLTVQRLVAHTQQGSVTDALSQGATSLSLTSALAISSGDANSNSILDIGETWIYSASFTVSQAVIDDGGSIANIATVDTDQTSPLASAAVNTPVSQVRTLLFAKSATLNGNPVGLPVATALAVGDVVTYRYDVSNTGNVTMSNVGVSDSHNGHGTLPVPGGEVILTDAGTPSDSTDATAANGQWSSLAPADTVRFTATYTVNQTDVDLLQ
jgi:hypothetical protein